MFNLEQSIPPHAPSRLEIKIVASRVQSPESRARIRSFLTTHPQALSQAEPRAGSARMEQPAGVVVRKFPGAVKLLIILGVSAGLWTLIIWAFTALLR
jgi:hypothetical protein